MDFLAVAPGPPDWALDPEALLAGLPVLGPLASCPQDPEWHAEGDVWTHTKMVLEALCADPAWRALTATARAVLFWAALLHDVAKPPVTRTGTDGRISSRGHSRLGAIEARRLLWHLGAPIEAREQVCALVEEHQVPFFLVDRADARRRALAISLRVRCDWLSILTRADAVGRRCADQQRLLDQIELFRLFCEEQGCLDGPWPFPSDHSRVRYFDTPGRDPEWEAFDDTRCTLTLLSGLPGSGKSSWIERHGGGQPVIGLDRLRAELGIPAQKPQGRVLAEARERTRAHLRQGRSMIWDATSISRDQRGRVAALARDYRARLRIVYLEQSPAEQRARNRQRAADVPRSVLQRMERRWQVPDLREAHQLEWWYADERVR